MRKRIMRWAALTVAVPLAAAGARKLGRSMEARRGPSGISGLLNRGADLLHPARARRRRRFGW